VKLRLGPYLNARVDRRSTKRAGVALVYHRVGHPAGDPRYELVPTLSTRLFEAQLSYLRRAYRIVAPSRLLAAASERRPGERFPVALTFDDDLRSHVDVVMRALLRARVPAAFFVSGPSVDAPQSVWWEDLQALVDRRDPLLLQLHSLREVDLARAVRGAPYAIHEAAEQIERLPAGQRDAVAAELRMLARRRNAGLTARDLQGLAAQGLEIGFHTRRHYLLTTLDDGSLSTALVEGREELEAIVGQRLRMIAYPHGKADARVAEAARVAGYEFAFTGLPVSVTPTTDALMMGRIEGQAVQLRDFARTIATTLAESSG
jgi:peptidoglycan/xylan/chitin deacetylase (PgdA/CDA1 family)